MSTTTPPREPRLQRLRFRAWRRGFREADLLLGPFTDRYAAAMTDDELDRLEAVMGAPDQDLYDWIVGREPVPAEHDHDVMERLRAFRFEMHATTDAATRGG